MNRPISALSAYRSIGGVGLGLRREHVATLLQQIPPEIDFFELAPENWMELPGSAQWPLRQLGEQRPLVAHGLSLSLGSPDALDEGFVLRIGRFLDQFGISAYSEHLSWCSGGSHLYDLLPIPLTEAAVDWVAGRIRRVQQLLGRRIAIENASYYVVPPGAEMSEAEWIRRVLRAADCDLHLDVNNVFVNSVNFGFDPRVFLQELLAERVVYVHMAGHWRFREELLIDTHGEAVSEAVWSLLDFCYDRLGPMPTLLERDFQIPPLADLLPELRRIRAALNRHPRAAHGA